MTGVRDMIEITRLSAEYEIRKMEEEDIPAVLKLCRSNPMYYYYDPPEASEESIRSDMTILPPRTDPVKKHYIGFFKGGVLTAVMDLIDGYPDKETAYIGFFMVHRDASGQGLGTRLITEVCEYLKEAGFFRVMLCYIKGNMQSRGFWLKNGFAEIREAPTEKKVKVEMERRL